MKYLSVPVHQDVAPTVHVLFPACVLDVNCGDLCWVNNWGCDHRNVSTHKDVAPAVHVLFPGCILDINCGDLCGANNWGCDHYNVPTHGDVAPTVHVLFLACISDVNCGDLSGASNGGCDHCNVPTHKDLAPTIHVLSVFFLYLQMSVVDTCFLLVFLIVNCRDLCLVNYRDCDHCYFPTHQDVAPRGHVFIVS